MLKEKGFIKGTIAQAVICVLIFPFTACVIRMFSLDIGKMFTDLINQIFVMEVWFDLLVKYSNIQDVIAELENFSDENLKKWSFMMLEVWMLALISGIVKDLAKKLGMKGLPILPTFFTVIVFAVTQKIAGISFLYALIEIFVLIIIYLCIKFFVSKVNFLFTILTGGFKLYIDSCVALASTMYIAVLALIIKGNISGFADISVAVCMSMSALVLSLLVDFLLSGLLDKK